MYEELAQKLPVLVDWPSWHSPIAVFQQAVLWQEIPERTTKQGHDPGGQTHCQSQKAH